MRWFHAPDETSGSSDLLFTQRPSQSRRFTGVVMSRSINKVFLFGEVCDQPVSRHSNNSRLLTLKIRTPEEWFDRKEEIWKSKDCWHTIVARDVLADRWKDVIKQGIWIYVEGESQTRKYQDQSGQDRHITGVIAKELLLPPSSAEPSTHQDHMQSSPGDPSAGG